MVTNTRLTEGVAIRTFDGLLKHKNPICPKCNRNCFSLYSGGVKEKLGELFICRFCKTIYTLPLKKKCEFTEEER